jgi:hypothetical protein
MKKDDYADVNQDSDRAHLKQNKKTSERGRKNKVTPMETDDNLLSQQSEYNNKKINDFKSSHQELNIKNESNKQHSKPSSQSKLKLESSIDSGQGSEDEKSG